MTTEISSRRLLRIGGKVSKRLVSISTPTTPPRTSPFIRAGAAISALLLALFGHPMDVAHADLPAPPDGEAWIVMRDKSDESMNYVLLNLKKAGRRQKLTCGGGLQDQFVTCGAQPY
jgi:hypothetical protein